MRGSFLHLTLTVLRALLRLVYAYLVQPLPAWQKPLVVIAGVISTASALVSLSLGLGAQSLIAFLLLFLVSRPVPPKRRWLWPVAMCCVTYLVGSAPYTWLQVHGLL